MKMKRLFCSILVIIFVLSQVFTVFSCAGTENDKKENPGGNPGTDSSGGTEEEVNARLLIKEEIPELDYGGKSFNILYPEWSMYNDYYFAEEDIGEALNSAVYERMKYVENRFNLKISPVSIGYDLDNFFSTMQKSVSSGSDDYHLGLTHCIYGLSAMISSGILVDWNTIPHVDFDKPWWNQRMNGELSINGVLLTAVSDFIIFDPNVIYFNKKMINDIDLETPYDFVKNGQWTWDKLADMAKKASNDINGDGVFDEADQYGFVTLTSWMMDSALHAYGLSITKRDEDGYPLLNLENPKFYELMDKLNALMFTGNQTYVGYWDPNLADGVNESAVPMSTGRVLFHVDPLSAAKRYRTYDVDFGILPFPKSNETQEYLSLSWNGFMVIPSTADLEMVGAVCEALAAESYRYVIPAYYDVLLTSKVARDDESVEMLDIIFKGATYDFALNLGNWVPLSMPITQLQSNRITDTASWVEKNKTLLENQIKSIFESVEKNYTY